METGTKTITLKIGLAQITPVWLNREKTLDRINAYMVQAGKEACDLVAFGEALLPGYPFWLGLTGGATFNSKMQKEIHAHYARNAIRVEAGDLDILCETARKYRLAAYVGMIERAVNRGGHSLYCSLVYIDREGTIGSVHRKLQPTYEERLTWSPGDGHGLRVHSLGEFTAGGLNCWENWMPLSRAALYGQGEDLHVAVWPGSRRNTEDITRFIARESRSYVVSVSGLMGKKDVPADTPYRDEITENAPDQLADGGSCVAGPDGEWVLAPVVGREGLFTVGIDFHRVLEERQNFDPAGHYSRPGVTRLILNRERQSILSTEDTVKDRPQDTT
jgi:nitrilase